MTILKAALTVARWQTGPRGLRENVCDRLVQCPAQSRCPSPSSSPLGWGPCCSRQPSLGTSHPSRGADVTGSTQQLCLRVPVGRPPWTTAPHCSLPYIYHLDCISRSLSGVSLHSTQGTAGMKSPFNPNCQLGFDW